MAPKRPRGRPSVYSEEIVEKFLALVAEGLGLRVICQRDGMPSVATICLWLSKDDAFSERYARAKEVAAILMSEEILEIADNLGSEHKDTIEGKFGTIPNKEWILRSRLRVDARLTLMEKLYPKKYGPKLDQKVSAKISADIPEGVQERMIERMSELAPFASTVAPPASFRGTGGDE